MGENTRKHWKGEEILAILKRHLIEKVEISKVCQEADIAPSQFYKWQAHFFADGAVVFERKNGSRRRAHLDTLQKIATLEEKIQRKDSVMAELLEEHVKLKKKQSGEA